MFDEELYDSPGVGADDDYSTPPLKRFLRTAGVGALPPGSSVQPVVTRQANSAGSDALSGASGTRVGTKVTIPAQPSSSPSAPSQAGSGASQSSSESSSPSPGPRRYQPVAGGRLMVPDSGPSVKSPVGSHDTDALAASQRGETYSPFSKPLPSDLFIQPKAPTLAVPGETPGETADQQHLRDVLSTRPDPQDPKYKLSKKAQVGHLLADFLMGLSPAAGRFQPLPWGPGAHSRQYELDVAKRDRDIEDTKSRIGSYDEELKHTQQEFSDRSKLAKDRELDQARNRRIDTQQDKLDPNSVEKSDDSPTGFYIYSVGDTKHENPQPFTPKGYQKPAPVAAPPRTYAQTVTAWATETDPKKKDEYETAMKRIESSRFKGRLAPKIPQVGSLTPDGNRDFRAQMIAEGIPQRRAALSAALKDAPQSQRAGLQSQIDKLDARSKEILDSVRVKPKSGAAGSSQYTSFAEDGKGNRLGYNPKSKRWEPVKK